MALRITVTAAAPRLRLKLDGRLTGETTPELHRACAKKGQVVLELAELQFADHQGVTALRDLRAQGAVLIGASQFIQLLLDGVPEGGAQPRRR